MPVRDSRFVVIMATVFVLSFIACGEDSQDAPPVPVENTSHAPGPGWTVVGTVDDVHDGDTITIKVVKYYKVRLIDCWAPEVTGPQKPDGIRSRANLHNFSLGRQATVFVPETPSDVGKSTSMGRFLGHVWVRNQNLSEKQVEDGMACRTKRECEEMFGPLRLRDKEDGK